MKKLFLLTTLFAVCLQTAGWCQTGGDGAGAPVSKLNNLLASHITEKAYLHFDKPYYAAGDTIYFKAYVTQGERHQLSKISGVLHVDLVNTANKIDQSIKLHLDSGIAMGDFSLPDSLPPGSYQVRAYTRWMKNYAGAGIFTKVITIGSVKRKTIVYESGSGGKATGRKADLQFFPEGGYLVKGIRSRVAFKAIGADGKGIAVKGVVTDNSNTEVKNFQSSHLGMGSFYVLPEEGKTYKATLSFADGSQNIVDLPAAQDKGLVLAVDNRSADTFYAGIFANKAYFDENKGKTLSLVVYSGGVTSVVTSTLDNPQLVLHLPKNNLKTGIAQITLFNATGEPLNERLAFIQNPDQLNIAVQSDKAAYKEKEKATLHVSSNVSGQNSKTHFSVSVIDEGKVPSDESDETTILSYLLLSSDLKGNIEQPNFYFTDTSAYARSSLDVLMLTQGYRRFTWKQVMDNSYPPVAYQPEKGLEIDGEVKSLFGKRISGGVINLIPSGGGPTLSSVTDDKGAFKFSNLIFNDTTRFVLNAVNTKGQNTTKIAYFEERPWAPAMQANPNKVLQPASDSAMTVYLNNDKQQLDEQAKYYRLKGQTLKEVKIKQTKLNNSYRTQSFAGAGNADQVMHADEIGRVGGTLLGSLNGRLRGVTFIAGTPYLTTGVMSGIGGNAPQPMLMVIDGTVMVNDAMNPYDINMINSGSVETIEVLKSANTSIYGVDGAGGVLVITTKQGSGLNIKDVASTGVLPIAPMGFYKAREFYSPKYDDSNLNAKQGDFRSTIFWKPELVTNNDGNASFEYYNAGSAGTYKVIVEGIDSKGNIGRQVFRYRVE